MRDRKVSLPKEILPSSLIIREKKLSNLDMVYLLLKKHPLSREEIAVKTGLGFSSIDVHIRILKKQNLIEIEKCSKCHVGVYYKVKKP